jgi:AcrR family transcriptional regulator
MAAARRRKPRFAPLKVPRQERARVTYASVLDAAARIVATRGYSELTTNHVARAAGVAIGSVYEYFPDKETIVAEVARRAMREMAAELAEGLDATREVAEREGLEVALRRWVALLFRIVEDRRALLAGLGNVAFLRDLDEVRALPAAMVALAGGGRPLASSRLFRGSPEAWTYVVTTMVMNTVLESVVARPAYLTRDAIRETLVRILLALMTDAEPD